jgi:hypothetical protein
VPATHNAHSGATHTITLLRDTVMPRAPVLQQLRRAKAAAPAAPGAAPLAFLLRAGGIRLRGGAGGWVAYCLLLEPPVHA